MDDGSTLMTGSASIPPWEWTVLAISLLASALFSALETVLVQHTPAKTQQLIEEHPRHRRMLDLWLKSPEHLLTTILVGNNIVNISASVLGGAITERLFPDGGVGIAIGAMTFLVLVFGEITPKSIARHFSRQMIFPALRLLHLFHWALLPVAWPLGRFAGWVIGLFGLQKLPSVLPDELQYLIGLGARERVLDRDRASMLDSVFDLSHTVAREVMVPRPAIMAVDLRADPETITRMVIEHGFSRLPVFRDRIDNIVGILHVKDLFRYYAGGGKGFDLEKTLRPIVYVPENQPILKLLKLFQQQRTHIAIVVDEYGGVAGMVTLEDVLEEIVGPIMDEYDLPEKSSDFIRKINDHTWLIGAQIHVDDLEEHLGLSLPDPSGSDAYDTLAGFIVSHFDRVPEPGQSLEIDGARLTVKQADRRRVIAVELTRPAAGAA